MKKLIINLENPNGTEVDLTSEEIAEKEEFAISVANEIEAEENARQEKENLKASAKAKLMAGEPMTEEEANLTLHI